ncbi:hypothetical protein T12_6416 [Trichinella patagoniensis]|uniref:Uncharacterized protein n=1 Tax=Trichinella patagoniensis TaxID=990121 RepID=A0A0V0Z783_9BILA|nr:hypothetical protein T12_6416 [Trichinella patagoniensis]
MLPQNQFEYEPFAHTMQISDFLIQNQFEYEPFAHTMQISVHDVKNVINNNISQQHWRRPHVRILLVVDVLV